MSDEEARRQVLAIIDQLLARAQKAEAALASVTRERDDVISETHRRKKAALRQEAGKNARLREALAEADCMDRDSEGRSCREQKGDEATREMCLPCQIRVDASERAPGKEVGGE